MQKMVALDYIKHTFEFSGDHKSGVLEYSSPQWDHKSGVSDDPREVACFLESKVAHQRTTKVAFLITTKAVF